MRRGRPYIIGCGLLVSIGIISSIYRLHQPRPDQALPATTLPHAAAGTSLPPQPRMSLQPDIPTRLHIEALDVDAPITGVDINTAGEMQAPSTAGGISWYRRGYLPGALGNAVLAGHSWHTDGKGAFYQLDQLQNGNVISVDTVTHRLHFAVTSRATYPSTSTDLTAVFGSAKTANLKLITCIGDWDSAERRYSDRLIVTATFTHQTALP